MPGYDKTGPEGKGPMTGREQGYCNGTIPKDEDRKKILEEKGREYGQRREYGGRGQGLGRGAGIGWGRGRRCPRGRGQGLGRGFGFRRLENLSDEPEEID